LSFFILSFNLQTHLLSLSHSPVGIETKAGHGAGKSTSQRIEESADVFAFIAQHTGAKWHA
jgi:prolyl oligopeptidase PreP (S9A serine peptidase family)